MSDMLQRISTNCIGLSYLLAFLIELVRFRFRTPGLRLAGLLAGFSGLVAHTIFLAGHHPNPATSYGAALSVSWMLAVFYLIGAIHHTRQAWAVFVLPIMLTLVGLAFFAVSPSDPVAFAVPEWMTGDHIWGMIHGVFVLLAALGVCVGGIASLMYLVQARRLRQKKSLLSGLKILSLERLEAMNRRAVNIAFPMLTIGLLLGVLLLRQNHDLAENMFNLKVLSTVGLWATFLVLLYLRSATHLPGRRLAWLTLAAFVLMLVVLFATHPFAPGRGSV